MWVCTSFSWDTVKSRLKRWSLLNDGSLPGAGPPCGAAAAMMAGAGARWGQRRCWNEAGVVLSRVALHRGVWSCGEWDGTGLLLGGAVRWSARWVLLVVLLHFCFRFTLGLVNSFCLSLPVLFCLQFSLPSLFGAVSEWPCGVQLLLGSCGSWVLLGWNRSSYNIFFISCLFQPRESSGFKTVWFSVGGCSDWTDHG